jgi:hypothetical protein
MLKHGRVRYAHEYGTFLAQYARIQEGKNGPEKRKQLIISSLKSWMFSFEG